MLISQDPGARRSTSDEDRRALRLLARDARGRHAVDGELVDVDHPEAPREQMVAIAMDFAWLGLERLSRGERWPTLNELRPRRRRRRRRRRAWRWSRSRANGERREIAFGEVAERSARLAGALAARGVGRGDVVMTLVGNRPEWVYAMLACWRLGAVAQPCTEQLRPARPARAHGDGRAARRSWPTRATSTSWPRPASTGRCWPCPTSALRRTSPPPAAELAADDPALIVFTSGTAGEPKPIRHGHGYLYGQSVQAEHWYGARPGDLCWCTAASGWSLSARNAFVAAWLRGAAALLHDARFDPAERLELLGARARERALHVAHRVPRDREARGAAAAAGAPPCLCRRRAAQPGGGAGLAGAGRGLRARRLRPDRDRPPDRDADRAAGPARLDGPAAARLSRLDRRRASSWWTRRPCRPSSSTGSATGPGAPATACARTRTATSGSRAAPTT